MPDHTTPASGRQPGRRWVEYMPLDELRSAARNPRRHNMPALHRSIDEFGYVDLIIMDERTGRLVAGHGRRNTIAADHDAGKPPPEGVQVAPDGTWLVPVQRGWASRDDRHAERFLVNTNRVGDLGDWDYDLLADVLGDQDEEDLAALGWNPDEIDALLTPPAGDDTDSTAGDGDEEEDEGDETGQAAPGELLIAAGVTVGEPDYQTAAGQVWRLGHHHLAVTEVITGVPVWRPLLTDDALFLPYPSLLAPHTDVAKRRPLLMVQPNLYLAGWLLTKWRRITGTEPTLVEPK